MADVTITITGGAETAAKMQKLGQSVLDLGEPMAHIGRYLAGFFSGQVFASRGRVIGEPWAPLDDRYAAYKARKFAGRQPLVRTGRMQKSFRFQRGPRFVRLYNPTPYFGYNQEGTSHLPARVMMKVDQQRELEIGRIIGEYLEKAAA